MRGVSRYKIPSKMIWTTFSLLLLSSGVFAATVTHQDLEDLNAVCETLDSCGMRRTSDTLDMYTCHCSRDCYKYGTCCVDARSKGRPPPAVRPSCRSVNNNDVQDQPGYFMTDSCPAGSAFEAQCREDIEGDLMSRVPVTSLSTSATYRNYFCFRCHEQQTEDFKFWNIRINASNNASADVTSDVSLDYDHDSRTWLAAVGEHGAIVPVSTTLKAPPEVSSLLKVCLPGAVSVCSPAYRSRTNIEKCKLYTSYVYIIKASGRTLYRNPHCALCNSERLDHRECATVSGLRGQSRRPFSFALLLDINQKDGDRVGMAKVERCTVENQVWDPFFKRCRGLTCALPGHVIRNGQCVSP